MSNSRKRISLRSAARAVKRRVEGLLRRVCGWPGDLYAKLYIRFSFNRLFHDLGFSPSAQIRLIPDRLPVTRRLMAQPYWICLSALKWGGRPSGGERRQGRGLGHGFIFDGDWDLEDKRDIDEYLSEYIYSRTIYQIWHQGIPVEQTDQYKEMLQFVERGLGHLWQARGSRSEADIRRYFDGLRRIFESIRDSGYRSQEDIGSARWFDEIKVFVDRNGDVHKQQGAGHHRLAMAKILQVPHIPVLVLGVHREWALRVQRELGLDVISSVDLALRNRFTRVAGGKTNAVSRQQDAPDR